MKKKVSPITSKQVQSEELQTNNIYRNNKGILSIGGEKITEQMRSALKNDADYILRSRLWEILLATIENEAFTMGVHNSANWEHVLSAKQLLYWRQIFKEMLETLAK